MCFSILNIRNNKWYALFSLIFLSISYLLFQGIIDRIVIPILGIDLKTFFPLFLYFFSGSVYFHFIKFIPFNLSSLLVCGILIILLKNNFLPELLHAFILPYLIFSFAFSKKI
jgi:hypothetical protein